MMDQPSMRELVEAVREFLEQKAMPELKGHTAFHARVAANALAIVARQLERGADADAEEIERLRALLGRDGTPEELNRALCQAIRTGELDIVSPELQQHLERTARTKIEIDQPNYSGLRIARQRD
jgi:Domain of unknown function (DUF6285)